MKGKWEEAFHLFERIWLDYPESEYANPARIRALEISLGPLGQEERAKGIVKDLLKVRDPVYLERALKKVGEYALYSPSMALFAILALEKYRKTFPSPDPNLLLFLAELYVRELQFEPALEILKPFLNNNLSYFSRAGSLYGRILLQKGDLEEGYRFLVENIPRVKEEERGEWEILKIRYEEFLQKYPLAEERLKKTVSPSLSPVVKEYWLNLIQMGKEQVP
jgi:hypothetical protein